MQVSISESILKMATQRTILHDVDPNSKIASNSLKKKYSYDINDNDVEIYEQKYRQHLKEKYERELEESI